MDFVDLIGASGRSYRFRVWPGPAHPPIAGNYLVYDLDKASPITFGLLENLAEAATRVGRLRPRAKLYTRLNVSRAHREAEHADLAACHPKAVAADMPPNNNAAHQRSCSDLP